MDVTTCFILVIEGESALARYARAPIVECVVDIRCRIGGGTPSFETLSTAVDPVKADYPTMDSVHEAVVEMQGGPVGAEEFRKRDWQTPLFRSVDGRRGWRATPEGFSYSQLHPYDHWEAFKKAAFTAWSAYRSVLQPERLTRVALKYVNRIDIPLPLRDFKDYLRTVPEVSPAMPQGLSGLFMQLQIPIQDVDGMLILTQAMVPPARVGVVSLILDIDLFNEKNVAQSDEELSVYFDRLRDEKNKVFEACITDATRELIS